ncbi:MAG: hypothetical protein VXW76_03480 [Actinomycetota bacterium]|nr:hypothetical protein [Actinomycetota bacterium]
MKITKRQLRRIIKEEKQKLLAESRARRIVRRRLVEQVSGGSIGKVLIPDGGDYLVADVVTDPATGMPVAANPQPLPEDAPFISAWESEDLDGAIEALRGMGINFIGGDDADMAAEELGIKPEIIRLSDFAETM